MLKNKIFIALFLILILTIGLTSCGGNNDSKEDVITDNDNDKNPDDNVTDPTEPTEPTEPTDPIDPTEPIDPADPTDPGTGNTVTRQQELLEEYTATVKSDYYNRCQAKVNNYFPNGLGDFKITQEPNGNWWNRITPLYPSFANELHPIIKTQDNEKTYAFAGKKQNSEFVVSGINIFSSTKAGYDLNNETYIQTTIINRLLNTADFTQQPLKIAYTSGTAARNIDIKSYLQKHSLDTNVEYVTDTNAEYDILFAGNPYTLEIETALSKNVPIFVFYNNKFETPYSQDIFGIKLLWDHAASEFSANSAAEMCNSDFYQSLEKTEIMLDYIVNDKYEVQNFDNTNACVANIGKYTCDYSKIFDASGKSLQEIFYDPINFIKSGINYYDKFGKNIFNLESSKFISIPLQISDIYRQKIEYKDFYFRKMDDYNLFLKTLFTDLVIHYARPDNVINSDLGKFSPNELEVQSLQTKTITHVANLGVNSNITAIPVYIKAGTTVNIKRLDDNIDYVNMYINYQRDGASRIYDNGETRLDENGDTILNPDGTEKIFGKYNRPFTDRSHVIRISQQADFSISSPKGGLVFLELPRNKYSDTVTISFENVLDAIFLDEFSEEKITNFINTMETSPMNWVSIATDELQIHSSKDKMLQIIQEKYNANARKYIDEIEKYILNATYGYAGILGRTLIGHSTSIEEYCASIGASAECANTELHKINKTQHLYLDRAECSDICSGNPIDSNDPLNTTGWEELKEIGYVLQEPILNIYGNRSNEVSNNIFALEARRRNALNNTQNYYDSNHQGEWIFNLYKENLSENPSISHPIWVNSEYSVSNLERFSFYKQLIYASKDYELFTKLYILNRIASSKTSSSTSWDEAKVAYGFSTYSSEEFRGLSAEDFMLIAASKIANRDLTDFFRGFGVATSAKAQAQVDSFTLSNPPLNPGMYSPPVNPEYYTPVDFANWIDIEDYYIEFTSDYIEYTVQ